uniref:Uncharacterized protein n=1 Tax=Magallana gigas TaxID=29159 RepID=A0A8W8LXU6_MAGGI|nr:uncharacterized protein LOC105332753 isoform X1 [Crassostrea gigas]
MTIAPVKKMFVFYAYYLLMYELANSEGFKSEMCLEQTLQIHALLEQKICPYSLLASNAEYEDCSVRCEGIYVTVRNEYAYHRCVGYTINFNISGMLTSSLRSFLCNLPNCVLEMITFECTFIKRDTDIKSNKTTNEENDLQKKQNMDVENSSCFGVDTGAVIGFSFAVVGGVLGVLCFFVLVKHLRTRQRSRFCPSKFCHPHTDDCCQVPMEREVMIAGQAAKGTKTMEDKAIQVSYYKENDPHEPRLKENKLYQLYLKEDHPESYGSVLLSSDFIQES